MKNDLLSFLCLLALNSCFGQDKKLSDQEIVLITELNFDQKKAEKIKNLAHGDFKIAKGNEDRDMLYEDIPELKSYSKHLPPALKINASAALASKIVKDFREDLKLEDLIIYISEEHFGKGDDVVTILKSKNKYEPLYFEATNAVNYDMNTPDLVKRLKLWDQLYGIEFNGIGFDFLSGDFKTLPKNLDEFSQEVYEFCPDIVDQGVGDIDELKAILKKSKQFVLWWD